MELPEGKELAVPVLYPSVAVGGLKGEGSNIQLVHLCHQESRLRRFLVAALRRGGQRVEEGGSGGSIMRNCRG